MFIKKRKLFFSILLLIIAGTLPQVFHTAETSNFSIHATLTYPFLIILIGYGIFEIINYFKNNKIQTGSLIIILVLYVISAANFFNIYTSWYPIQGYSDFPIRIVSSYSQRAAPLQKIVVYSNSSFDSFKKFIFYTNWYNKNTAQKISQNLNAKNYSFGNVTFKSCNIPNIKNTNEVSIIDSKCTGAFIGKSNLIIPQLKDGGATFVIYNDKICRDAKFSSYLSNFKLADFDLEQLSNVDFCEKFIVSQ